MFFEHSDIDNGDRSQHNFKKNFMQQKKEAAANII